MTFALFFLVGVTLISLLAKSSFDAGVDAERERHTDYVTNRAWRVCDDCGMPVMPKVVAMVDLKRQEDAKS